MRPLERSIVMYHFRHKRYFSPFKANDRQMFPVGSSSTKMCFCASNNILLYILRYILLIIAGNLNLCFITENAFEDLQRENETFQITGARLLPHNVSN